jgi:arylsulfatase A-like enzyme
LGHTGATPRLDQKVKPSKFGAEEITDSASLWHLVATALWLAAVGSLIEIVVLLLQKRANPLLRVSDDFVWMAPAAVFAAILVIMTLCALLARVRPRRTTLGVLFCAPAFLTFLSLLMLIPRLSHYAAAVLAFGLAVQTTRLAFRSPNRFRRLVHGSTPALAVCFALVGAAAWFTSPQRLSRPAAGQTVSGSRPLPNIVLVTLDTVRAANLSVYGYSRRTTPHLEELVKRGVVFERAFATAPWTLPSHASLFTGRWPHQLSADYASPLDSTYPTLAEYLAGYGYRTAGFVANLGYCSRDTGLARGFEHYEDYQRSLGQIASSSTLVRKVADNFNLRRVLQNDQHLNRIGAAELNDRVLTWASSHAVSPFFVFINYFDAHEPYLPPESVARRFGPGRKQDQLSPLHHWLWDVSVDHRTMTADELREEIDAYDASIAYLDERLSALIDEMTRLHLLDNAVIVITSDHGEEFGEHGVFDHGYTLYRQALQVPLVILAPGQAPGAHRVRVPVSLRNVPATIADLVGLGPGAPFPGESLKSHWAASDGRTADGAGSLDALLSEVGRAIGQPAWFPASKGGMKALFYKGFHYIQNGDGQEELYELDADPLEERDVATIPDYQRLLSESRAMLQRVLSESGHVVK